MSNGTDTKRIANAGSLQTPSIVRRKPSMARDIMRRNRHNPAPTRNTWIRAAWTANTIIRTIFAIIGAIVVLVIGLVFFGGF